MIKNFSPQNLKNQKGQVAVEYILLTVVMTFIAIAAHQTLSSSNAVANYVQGPWQQVAGLIETGVWGDARRTRTQHPGKIYRHLSLRGESE
jgi:hypothetical protein